MSYWCDDAGLGRQQRALDARQAEAKERALFKSIVHGLRSQGWSKADAEAEAIERLHKAREAAK